MDKKQSHLKREWYEDDTFWEDTFSFMANQKVLERSKEEVQQIIGLSQIPINGKVLDLACGFGRHSVHFAKRGYKMTGVDLSLFMIDKARGYAEENGCKIEYVKADMRTFRRECDFDLIINLFMPFGYWQNADEDMRTLRNIYASLKKEGVFIVDMGLYYQLNPHILMPLRVIYHDKNMMTLLKQEVKDNGKSINLTYYMFKGGHCKTRILRNRIYTQQEFQEMLCEVGFKTFRFFRNFREDPFLPSRSEKLVIVAQKTP